MSNHEEPLAPQTAPEDVRLELNRADFDAYLPERATSNAFTRPRLELKQRMMVWAKGVSARLSEMGIFAEMTGSDEHPNLRNHRRVDSQRVFFWRDAAARHELESLLEYGRSLAAALDDPAPYKKHVHLGLRVDSQSVGVSVELYADAWVDVKNFRARLADPGAALELASLFESLPEEYCLGIGDGERLQASQVSTAKLRALLDSLEPGGKPLWIGWTVPRELALEHAPVLSEQLADAIVALGPLYAAMAWSPENDRADLEKDWERARIERQRAHAEAEKGELEWQAKLESERRGREPRGRHALSVLGEGRKSRASDLLAAAGPPSSRHDPAIAPRPERPEVHAQLRPARPVARRAPRITLVDRALPIEKGARVQVLEGPFEGKQGIVQELDGKGGARVLLGLLAVRMETKLLAASSEGRAGLSSSHRKLSSRA